MFSMWGKGCRILPAAKQMWVCSPGSQRPSCLPAPCTQTLRCLRGCSLASANSSGLLWESRREEAGGKADTLLLLEVPKSGSRPIQRVKDLQFRFSLQSIYGSLKQWDRAGSKQGRSFQCIPGCSPESALFGYSSLISAPDSSCRKFYTCALEQSPDIILCWEQATCLLKAEPGEVGGRGGRGAGLALL